MRTDKALQDRMSIIEVDLFDIAGCKIHLLALDILLPMTSEKRCSLSLNTYCCWGYCK